MRKFQPIILTFYTSGNLKKESWWSMRWSSPLYLVMSVLYTESLSWKAWLLTARLCSSLNGSSTTPSRTGKVRRRSSLGLPWVRKQIWHVSTAGTRSCFSVVRCKPSSLHHSGPRTKPGVAPSLWNSPPKHIWDCSDHNSFKSLIKTYTNSFNSRLAFILFFLLFSSSIL